MNRAEYEEFQKRFQKFMESEGIQNLSLAFSEGEEAEPFFSWEPCECCRRPIGGTRQIAGTFLPS